MTKISSLIGVSVAATTSGISCVALSGGLNENNNNHPRTPVAGKVAYKKASEIKGNYKELKCIPDLFGDSLNWNDDSKVTTDFYKSGLKFDGNSAEGCLAVWWEREDYPEVDGNFWRGSFHLTWAIKDNQNGTILYTTLNTQENGYGNLYAESIAYRLTKENSNWKVVAKISEEESQITDSNKEVKIIKPSDLVEKSGGDNWGFNFDIYKICSAAHICSKAGVEKKTQIKEWTLIKENDSQAKSVHGWSSNVDKWNVMGTLFSGFYVDTYEQVKGKFKPKNQ